MTVDPSPVSHSALRSQAGCTRLPHHVATWSQQELINVVETHQNQGSLGPARAGPQPAAGGGALHTTEATCNLWSVYVRRTSWAS